MGFKIGLIHVLHKNHPIGGIDMWDSYLEIIDNNEKYVFEMDCEDGGHKIGHPRVAIELAIKLYEQRLKDIPLMPIINRKQQEKILRCCQENISYLTALRDAEVCAPYSESVETYIHSDYGDCDGYEHGVWVNYPKDPWKRLFDAVMASPKDNSAQ